MHVEMAMHVEVDFRRITLFCLEKRLSKHKKTIFSENLGGTCPFCPPLATPMIGKPLLRQNNDRFQG